jgi:hypothetical protein
MRLTTNVEFLEGNADFGRHLVLDVQRELEKSPFLPVLVRAWIDCAREKNEPRRDVVAKTS